MKISIQTSRGRNERGSATLIVIILLGTMLVFIASNTTNLNQLKRELDFIEKKQVERLNQHTVATPDSKSNSRKP